MTATCINDRNHCPCLMYMTALTRLIIAFVTCAVLAGWSVASAQTLAEKEKQWESCEAAHYVGPREGRRNYTLDNYLWVVTPEFARRYCMPEHMVSAELQGAEAIAFRMVDGADMDRCGVDDRGQHHCTRQSSLFQLADWSSVAVVNIVCICKLS